MDAMARLQAAAQLEASALAAPQKMGVNSCTAVVADYKKDRTHKMYLRISKDSDKSDSDF